MVGTSGWCWYMCVSMLDVFSYMFYTTTMEQRRHTITTLSLVVDCEPVGESSISVKFLGITRAPELGPVPWRFSTNTWTLTANVFFVLLHCCQCETFLKSRTCSHVNTLFETSVRVLCHTFLHQKSIHAKAASSDPCWWEKPGYCRSRTVTGLGIVKLVYMTTVVVTLHRTVIVWWFRSSSPHCECSSLTSSTESVTVAL